MDEIFTDKKLIDKVKKRLPQLFQLAENESSRAGKIGMEIGSVRERIIIALLMHKFGMKDVNAVIPITEKEEDVLIVNEPISIKTITGLGGVKLIWTVDSDKAKQFLEKYRPTIGIILVVINWGGKGGLYYISKRVQKRIYKRLGRYNYMKLPKAGTNPRGVELSKEALLALIRDKETKSIEVDWIRKDNEIPFDPYKKWLLYWEEE